MRAIRRLRISLGETSNSLKLTGVYGFSIKSKTAFTSRTSGAMGGHDGIIGIHTCVSFMKVSCADAGNVSVTGTDMYQFGMNLQSLHSKITWMPASCILLLQLMLDASSKRASSSMTTVTFFLFWLRRSVL